METGTQGYKLTVGIEVHAELQTKTKMFCNSRNEPHASKPNTHVCPICMGHPGTLPVVNKEAVKHVLRLGIAVGGELADYTEFDRKNYFYPDIPKGYQISQYKFPLVKGGSLAGVKITRVHLEEDTARSQHDQGHGSLIDYNRAGVPLMELVTEPVIHDAKDAGNFARELQLLLRTLGVSTANMEKGEMRVEANISVSKTEKFGTKVEVKNLNSFRAVEMAIEYEMKRHIELIEEGETITQETRGWDEVHMRTYSQRIKESADDYRYFPEPDIPKFQLSKDVVSLSRLSETIPLLPHIKRIKYGDIGIPSKQIDFLISNIAIDNFFREFSEGLSDEEIVRLGANYIVSDLMYHVSDEYPIDSASVGSFRKLVMLVHSKTVNSRVAKDILKEVVFGGLDPSSVAKERGLIQEDDKEVLHEVVRTVLRDNAEVVEAFRNGKEASLQFLIGQGMKLSRGTANPMILKELFIAEINP